MQTHFSFARAQTLLALCMSVALSACSTLPSYVRPSVAVPAQYATIPVAGPGWMVAAPADTQLRGAWWKVFNDHELDQLEARVDVSNQTIQKAVAQLQEARSLVDYQHAGFLPTLQAGLSQDRTQTSQDVLYRAAAGKTVPDYAVGLTASWEPDLFGRTRDATTGAQANAAASTADLEAVRLSVTADIAVDYFELRALDTQKQLFDATVHAYDAALQLLQHRLQYGATDNLAIAQAQTQLEATRTQDTDIDVQRAQLQHAIATLVGESASTFSLAVKPEVFSVPNIPVGLPAKLLERRPDIAAAERRVAAANAQIGEAHAAFYPDLTLAASAGLESSTFGPWLSAPSLFWSIGPQLFGTLFDGGRRDATLRGANAQYDGSVADYRQVVLMAFAQVEDHLSALHTLADEAESQTRANAAASLALQLASNQYQAGAVDYLQVVNAQVVALTNQRSADQIAARRMVASVLLLKAIGGGWDVNEQPATLSSAGNPG